MKKREKEIFTNKGITLVALIITIIVLLILAGVSISFVFNGGILDKSQQAVDEYEKAAEEESDLLEDIENLIDEKYNTVDQNGLAIRNITIKTDDPNVQIVIPKGFAPVILQTERTDSLPGESGDVKEIMPIEEWKNITAEQINKGIVIVDHAITYDNGQATGTVPDFNEYVWIPISDSDKFKRFAWNGPYWDSEFHLTGTHPLANGSEENKYWEETTSSEYTSMVSSVSSNKGFYISRYEASMKDTTTAQSKRGQNPWRGLSQLEAITASSNMNPSINTHLVYGIEWDSVLQWALDSQATIGAESGGTKTITINDIQSDSSSWGNFKNSKGGAATNSGTFPPKPGGTNEYWKVNNIYDIAGNTFEWTQEKYSTDDNRTYRGGYCTYNGDDFSAAYRGYYTEGFKYNTQRVQSRLLCVGLYSGSIVM